MATLVKLLNFLDNSMTRNLALVAFNNRDNAAFSIAGWYVDAGMVVNTLAGNDIISGIGGTSNTDINNGIANKVSISNNGTIITGTGNDSIYGISDGIGIYNTGTINTGTGKDSITGIGNVEGINTFGTINTGAGNDTITGIGTGNGAFAIGNYGTINTGTGNDSIIGVTTNNGIGIYTFGTINTSAGNDIITGISTGSGLSSSKDSIFNIGIFNDESTIDTGTGNDIISGTGNFGISNTGTINTGAGNDIITGMSTGAGFIGVETGGESGIYNTGTINTGTGNDTVSSIVGCFSGNGSIDLGAGNDTLIGFGTGNFYGGTGIDKILLGEGTYKISGSTINSGGVSMKASQFEQIGGVNGGVFSYSNGNVIVNADGVASFA
jgi:hypothetical protein